MKIRLAQVYVNDQEKALAFYTDVLGFVKHTDVSAGEYRWLTVASPEEPDGPQLLLEPGNNDIARTYREALYANGIAASGFQVSDVRAEFERLKALGVHFSMEPTEVGGGTVAVLLDDTVGNWIQLQQPGT